MNEETEGERGKKDLKSGREINEERGGREKVEVKGGGR